VVVAPPNLLEPICNHLDRADVALLYVCPCILRIHRSERLNDDACAALDVVSVAVGMSRSSAALESLLHGHLAPYSGVPHV